MNRRIESISAATSKKLRLKAALLALFIVIGVLMLVGCAEITGAQGDATGDATADDGAGPLAKLLGSRSQSLQIVGLLTVLSIAPSILIMLTGFVRIVIVLSFTRNAMGLQQMPPNQVIVGLALFMTFFVFSPVLTQIKTEAYDPYVAQEITIDEAIDKAEVPVRNFMMAQTFKTDLRMFMDFADIKPEVPLDEAPTSALIPAFVTSEIKRGFEIGFFIYIPFIVIDMIVASTLMAMGMMMLPPVVISLPFKVLLFVMIDGWSLTMKTLLTTFG